MIKSDIEDKLRSYLLEIFFSGDSESLTNETQLLTTGIIDSISALEMVDFIEENFKIEFEAHEVDQDNLNSINALTNFILQKI
jgi:acyl carrier protein|tara:strand:- start:834 stop:1082 length:249 start_codon:yes stop_codon:yes gene_type:complete